MRVLVPVGIEYRRDVPIGVLNRRRFGLEVGHELVDDEGDRRRRDPLSGVDAAIHPDRFVAGVPVGDLEDSDRLALNGRTDGLDRAQVGVGLGQVVQVPLDV